MSISSMLGAEPEKPAHDLYHTLTSRTPSRQASVLAPWMSLGAVMSPPQYPSKPMTSDYQYKPRSQTPDRISTSTLEGPRQQRSSSGTMMQRPGPFYDSYGPFAKNPPPRYGEQLPTPPFGNTVATKNDPEERARRTSLSGILQRPESQPQRTDPFTPSSLAQAASSGSNMVRPSTTNGMSTNIHALNSADSIRHPQTSGSYDTRPPGTLGGVRHGLSQMLPERAPSQPVSPELRRPYMNGQQTRGLAGLLNMQPGTNGAAQPSEGASAVSHNMMRQDSAQSQSERSVLGDRLDRSRFRQYSPFAGSVASQAHSIAEDQGRKGSDELSQHRAILGLAADSKRSRFSPLPQAVQGAQAQTPVPDAGIKAEQGRVFSGIGNGIAASSATPAASAGLSASPFKRDEGVSRLSEDNLIKVSRSTGGVSKRPRGPREDEEIADAGKEEPKKGGLQGRTNKRSKHSHQYKADLEELDSAPSQQRKGTPLTGPNTGRRTGTPVNSGPYHHHHQRQTGTSEHIQSFKPKKTVKIGSVVAAVSRKPRRHLGTFTYSPVISETDINRPSVSKFDISIKPNLLPVFEGEHDLNCTYTIKVPQMWLKRRERSLICAERYLWGCGIYTDDSDPLAAAIHAGFVKAAYAENVDRALLDKVLSEQNTTIEGAYSNLPKAPLEPEGGKDLHITLVVMPPLENYTEAVRFGIKSRPWPEDDSHNPHDGVSFMVLKAEFVDDGSEARRMGRTGKERRARLRQELEERARGFQIEQERIATAQKRAKRRREEQQKRSGHNSSKQQTSTSASLSNGVKVLELNIGQSPRDWLGQLTVAAA